MQDKLKALEEMYKENPPKTPEELEEKKKFEQEIEKKKELILAEMNRIAEVGRSRKAGICLNSNVDSVNPNLPNPWNKYVLIPGSIIIKPERYNPDFEIKDEKQITEFFSKAPDMKEFIELSIKNKNTNSVTRHIVQAFDKLGKLNYQKLIKKKMLEYKKDSDGKVVPVTMSKRIDNMHGRTMQYGQHNEKNELNGVGRRIWVSSWSNENNS